MVSEFIQNRCRHTHIILNDYSGLLGNIAFKREKKSETLCTLQKESFTCLHHYSVEVTDFRIAIIRINLIKLRKSACVCVCGGEGGVYVCCTYYYSVP